MRERYPEFSEAVYFPSMDDCWRELKQGTVDAVRRLRETTLPPELKEKLRAFLKRSAQQ